MKIIFLPRYSEYGASSRYRHIYLSRFLDSKGLEVRCFPFFVKRKYKIILYPFYLIHRLYILLKYHNCLFYIEGDLFPYLPFNLFIPKLFIIDFDDPLWNYERIKIDSLNKKKWKKLVIKCKLLVSGSPSTLDYWQSLCDNNLQVHFTPTTFSRQFYKNDRQNRNDKHIGGWIGSPSTSKYIDSLFNNEPKLLNHFSWILVGYMGAYSKHKNITTLIWSKENELELSKKVGFAISPLDYDPKISAFKCGFKIVQYLGLGLNTFINDVGANKIWQGALGVHTIRDNWLDTITETKFSDQKEIIHYFEKEISSEKVFTELLEKIKSCVE